MALSLQESFDRSCRLCAEEQDVTIMMFGPEAEAMSLQNKLNKYLLIEIEEDDKLPKNICIKCCSKLQSVCDFIDKARQAQETLFHRSIALDRVCMNNQNYANLLKNVQIKLEPLDEAVTKLEVNVDPQMVFQNNDSNLSPKLDTSPNSGDVRVLNGADGENVTIKLIRREEICNDLVIEDAPAKRQPNKTEKPFQCTMCRRSFLTELALKSHAWTHLREDSSVKLFNCLECTHSFTNRFDFMKHLREHRYNTTCKLCGRVFRSQANLLLHVESHVTPCNAHVCKVCGRSYDKISNLKTHSITHSNERPFKCTICKKSFKRNQDLKFHINQHTGAKPYKCPFCERCFASSGNCYSHRNRMHPGRMVDSRIARYMRRVINLSREGPAGKTELRLRRRRPEKQQDNQ